MADQEFSSPGEHMKSKSSGSSGSSSGSYVSNNSGYSAIYYAPSVDSSPSNAYDSSDYEDKLYSANKYNKNSYNEANEYNYNLYNNALSWYERMQNSSIQRMVEDMKKAGINPVLAGKYGGYNVSMPNVPYNNNMPYLDVSSLGSYESSKYSSFINYINNQDNLDATQKNIMRQCATQLEIAKQNNQTSKENNQYTNDTNVAINEAKMRNAEYLQKLVNEGKITVQDMENKQRQFEACLKAGTDIIDALVPG